LDAAKRKLGGTLRSSWNENRSREIKLIRVDRKYNVWTKRVGDGPLRMLMLHGGPGLTHEYLECFENFLPRERVEFYYYDQLGSGLSDRPKDVSLWTVDRFREEVEQVRLDLGLDDFFLYGHSWGGILGIEYALKYQRHLKALIISDMTASAASYQKYLTKLREKFPLEIRKVLEDYEARGEYGAAEYQEAMDKYFYNKYMCRLKPWPEPFVRANRHTNTKVFDNIHGPNEFVATGTAKGWDRWKDLPDIRVPTLLLVGRYDTMSVRDIHRMGRLMPNSRVIVCKNGSHLSMYDDQQTYFGELLKFMEDVELNKFGKRKKVF
jgi:proline iminopeptidase